MSAQPVAILVETTDCMICLNPDSDDKPPSVTWELCQLHFQRLKFVLDQKGIDFRQVE